MNGLGVGRVRLRAWALRGVMHALVLAVVGLMIGLASLTASAAEQEQGLTVTPGLSPKLTTPADLMLRVGDSATLDDGALVVTLLAITEDSRCPKDVLCVWSGRAVVALHVELDGADRGDVAATLMPGRQGPSALDARVDRYTLELADVQPYPDRSHPEPTLQSSATIRVTAQ
ncbi:MAG: hypothetical protein IT306_24115 [Chloroflexi bacterium]|nr:hypothetical protein [Chloroflexota bacterium]